MREEKKGLGKKGSRQNILTNIQIEERELLSSTLTRSKI